MSVKEYGRLPLVPERTLRKHTAYEPADNRFRSAARLRQALLREQHGWPIGDYRTAKGLDASSAATSMPRPPPSP